MHFIHIQRGEIIMLRQLAKAGIYTAYTGTLFCAHKAHSSKQKHLLDEYRNKLHQNLVNQERVLTRKQLEQLALDYHTSVQQHIDQGFLTLEASEMHAKLMDKMLIAVDNCPVKEVVKDSEDLEYARNRSSFGPYGRK